MKTVLFITNDDNYVSRMENRMNIRKYQLIHSNSSSHALGVLTEEPIDMLLFDANLVSEMSAFLARVKEHYPKVIRLRLSEGIVHNDAYKDQVAKLNCSKTYDTETLWATIDKVFEIDDKVNNKELVNMMSTLKHLPTLPQMYFTMSKMIQENASVEDIANKIEEDPAITSNILKMANTAFYSAKTGSIRQAIMYIGLTNVKNIILTNAVFGDDGLDPKARDLHWEHVKLTNKILNAFYVEVLGKKLDINISSVGLLHDIGSVILMSNFPVIFDAIVKKINQNPSESFHDLEKEMLGFSHQELGGHLLDLWGLPYPMIEVALMHHDPLHPSVINRELVIATHIANYYAWKFMRYDKYDKSLQLDVFSALGVSTTHFENFFENLKKKL